MPEIMRILSRDAFARVLAEARAHTDQLRPAEWPLLAQVAEQLAFMAKATRRGRVPSDAECQRTTLGPLAAQNLESYDRDYADSLEELDYTFRRYEQLPPGPPVRRRGILQVWSGRHAFNKIVLELGVPRTISTIGAPLQPPFAPGVPHVHLLWDGVAVHVRAGGQHRLTIGGQPAWYGELAHRGWMTAGATTFRFLVEDRTPPPRQVEPGPARIAALAAFEPRCAAGSLYAVIDAARSARALQLLEESVDQYASLYDGEAGRVFDAVAPHVAHLREDSWLLERLVTEGWGEAWGIFVESAAGFDAVRRHLRKFLRVEVDGEPRPVFFRFYDPRVLGRFAEVITPDQRGELLAGMDAFIYEDDERRPQRLTLA